MSQIVKLNISPGISKEGTEYSNEGSWFDGDMVRFRYGYVESIGGWTKAIDAAFAGIGRFLHSFLTLDSENFMFIGTTVKIYLDNTGSLTDITPIRATNSLGTDTLTSGAVSTGIVTVTDTAHGATVGDYLTISGATTFDGLTTDQLNAEHVVVEVLTANTFTIDTGGVATSGATAGGGASISAEYQITSGLDSAVLGSGWTAGSWGELTWGEASGAIADRGLRLWFADSFGEDLVINIADGALYYWDASGGSSARAVDMTTLSGASNVPTSARKVLVSEADRHIIALGATTLGTSIRDPLLIRWSDSESATDWTPTTINSAGDIRLSQGSEIVTGYRTKRETLVWTDKSLHSLQFIGPPYVFGSALIADNVSIAGPNAVGVLNDVVYWMGHENFYRYDGVVSTLECPVRRYVFDDINKEQSYKIAGGTLASETEIWWFYPSDGSDENDRYVLYNFVEETWSVGTLGRSAWTDGTTGIRSFPQATSTDGFMYNHESGCDDGSTSPVTAVASYAESSDFDIGDGYQFMLVRRIIPDITFSGSEASSPVVTFSLTAKDYPGLAANDTETGTVTRTSASPVELYTKTIPLRARGRSAVVKVENNTVGVKWRLGAPRIEMRGDGRR